LTAVWKLVVAGSAGLCALLFLPEKAEATDVRLFGSVSAVPCLSGNCITLNADEVANLDFLFTSGTLRLEYWFFPIAYNGEAQIGYKTAEATLGQLSAGFSFFNVAQTVPFLLPPDGFYCPSFQLTEFTVSGYRPVDWINFNCRFVGVLPNTPPVAFFTASPSSGDAPLTVNLNGSGSSDSDGFIIDYGWGSSDGQLSTGVATSMTFTAPGTYEIFLVVIDDDGADASFSRTITVTVPPDPCETRPLIGPNSTVSAALTLSDCSSGSYFADLYRIAIPEDGTLTVDMRSSELDAFVGVVTADLTEALAEDDDSGDGTDARLAMPILAGDYVVLATSFGQGETGSYTLTTQFIPEPSSHMLAAVAFALTAGLAARRRRES
jgi:PKD repeat protein